MLYTINRKQFIANALATSYVWIDLIRDSKTFPSKYYFDETNVFYLSINYGGGEIVVIFGPYSSNTLTKAKGLFPGAVGFDFACNVDAYAEAIIKEKHGVTFLYRLQEFNDRTQTIIKLQKMVDDTCSGELKLYDDMYMSFLRENHGARLLNVWNREREELLNGNQELYLARNENDVLIGFVMVDVYKELGVYDISQITVEEPFQNKGYGKQILQQVIDQIPFKKGNVYYSSVSDDNIPSKKIAEYVGFNAVACRINIVL